MRISLNRLLLEEIHQSAVSINFLEIKTQKRMKHLDAASGAVTDGGTEKSKRHG